MALHPETRAAHAGCDAPPASRDVTPPIHLSTTFERAADGSYPGGYVYSRSGNPTRDLLERTLSELEGGLACAAFSSGMAAASAVLQSLRPGDHVVMADDVYHGVRVLARELLVPWGLDFTEADLTQASALERAVGPRTRLVWIETPSNPLLRVIDIERAAREAHSRGIAVLVDSTWSTPLLQRPLALGADLVVHSVTKFLAGHSDVLGGVVVARESDSELFEHVRSVQTHGGAVMDPFGAWLTLRGIRSLPARLERQCATAGRIAAYLTAHPAVDVVHYPGLPSDPGHAVARRQMSRFGAMLSFRVSGGKEAAMGIAARARIFRRATSLGGTESLIEHRASVEPQPTRTPDNLLRLSIGLEHADDLLEDLADALGSAT